MTRPRRAARSALGSAALAWAALLVACATRPAEPLPAPARDARVVLLGEVHDNPRHHALRAEWLRRLLADGRPTVVVFEQMDAARGEDLRRAQAAAPGDPDAVARAGGLDERGWRWPLHRPVLQAALDGGARVAGGNLPRDTVRAVVRQGEAAVPAALQPLLAGAAWTPARQQAQAQEITDGHCGALPPTMVAPMVLAQRVRDASLAAALLAAPAGHRVVLIAGNGHVRRDLGVPVLLQAAGVPPDQIAAIGVLERGGDNADADAPGRYDAVVRTEPEPRPDPCEAFRAPPAPPASGPQSPA
ncbi:ChaN family lipoprotein [Ideonella sp.]|uniref:ChaN family lipoprotein n=1 Tax=Ideonella sp. TaxID=1929293 RepID=UPI0035ADA9E7